MKNTRWTLSAAALCVMALSAYGCSSDPATSDDDADDDTTSSSSSGGKSSSSSGGKSSSSSGGKSSSSSGGSSGNGSSSSSGGSSSSSSGDAGASSSSGDGGGSSSGDGGSGACTALTLGAFENALGGGEPIPGVFLAPVNAQGPEDAAILELIEPATGAFDLSTETQYKTCNNCVTIVVGDKTYFQTQGTLTITDVGAPDNVSVEATLANARLVEVTVAPAPDYTSTPVPNGTCVTVANAVISVPAP